MLAFGVAAGAAARPGGWRAGVAVQRITPAEPVWRSGYEERDHPHQGVLRDLHVKALALEDETGRASVLVTAAAAAERCRRRFGTAARPAGVERVPHAQRAVEEMIIEKTGDLMQ